jgi:hypothetical protein
MLIRSLVTILIVVSSFILVTGQTPEVKKDDADKAARTTSGKALEALRDVPSAAGVDLEYVITELAKDMGLNVLFDPESRLENRKVKIELENLTSAAALYYVLMKEGLAFGEAGPKTILVATRPRVAMIAQAGGGATLLETVAAKTTGGTKQGRLRDIPFPAGVDLQFLIKELAKDMGLNVLFDSESRLENRKVRMELKNVTAAEALNYLLLQEGLVFEEAGPKTILVSNRQRLRSIPEIGVGITILTEQLARYFGVQGAMLIDHVRDDSVASKAGLMAGDVIVGIDGKPVRGVLELGRALAEKKQSDITLDIVRERKDFTVSLRLSNSAP